MVHLVEKGNEQTSPTKLIAVVFTSVRNRRHLTHL